MKILVINSGSSSIKYQLFQMPEQEVIAKGLLERIGEAESFFCQKSAKGQLEMKKAIADHEQGITFILGVLTDRTAGVIGSVSEIAGIGHRVVHGGEEFTASSPVTDHVLEKIREFCDLAPLHNPPNLMGIEACKKALPHAVEAATFDTAFHQTMPPHAYLYAIPRGLYTKFKIRRYGFHGTSHRYVSRRCAELLRRPVNEVNVITCHLGNGCSVCAVEKGNSVDTSMGFTPLEGLIMGTRCGDIDPAIVFYLIEKGYTPQETNSILNKKSGLLGVSEISNDMRNLSIASDEGDQRAATAIEMFNYRLKKYIGGYLAVLGRTDAIVFTGGIGENNVSCRRDSLVGLESLGVQVDQARNLAAVGTEAEISSVSSPVKVYVIPTNEELQIACDAFEITQRARQAQSPVS
jgi:acetate kinase